MYELQIAMAVASDAIEAVCMPPIALAAASDTIRPVAIKIRTHQVRASMLKTIYGFKNFMMKPLWGNIILLCAHTFATSTV